ncbi:bacteriocin class II family protein, partial [uncultured Duncaniella sp.]
ILPNHCKMKDLKNVIMGISSIVMVLATMLITHSCSNESPLDNNTTVESYDEETDGQKLFTYFQSLNYSSIEQAIEKAETLEDNTIQSRSTSAAPILDAVYSVVAGYQSLDFNSSDNYESIRSKLISVVDNHKESLTVTEYDSLIESIDIAILGMQYAVELQNQPVSRGIGDSILSAVKCIAGTAGSAGLGFLAGAGVGTVTLPVVGTVSGGAVGGWSGALVGIAEFC